MAACWLGARLRRRSTSRNLGLHHGLYGVQNSLSTVDENLIPSAANWMIRQMSIQDLPDFAVRKLRLLFLAVVGSTLIGCAHVPFDYPRVASSARDISAGGQVYGSAASLTRGRGGKSAFIPLVEGNDALGARLRLIESAERSIDAQYFLVKPDLAGGLFAQSLADAADRGVRVRLLVDDVFTTANDRQVAYLSSHQNIEVRLFNPLSRNSPKLMNFLLDFGRVNRRMHNKSLTVDNAMSIIGGRNIAEEYFQVHTDAEFADFDLLCAGPVARDIARTFDSFWNDSYSVPVEAFVRTAGATERQRIRSDIDDRADRAAKDIYRRAVNSSYLRDVLAGRVRPFFAKARVVTDSPDKLRVPVREGDRPLADALQGQMDASRSEILIVTPYFVPRREGADYYKSLRARGVRVRVVTNSLASTNHPYVHSGHARYRRELLEAGVELYEVRADAPQILGQVPAGSSVKLTMHSKAAIFDRKRLYVGSLNFDPRSIEINTELGLFLSDRTMAAKLARDIDEELQDYTYAVGLDKNGAMIWTYSGAGRTEVRFSDPGAGFFSRLVAGIAGVLPVEGQL